MFFIIVEFSGSTEEVGALEVALFELDLSSAKLALKDCIFFAKRPID